ncbi:MAG: thioredoxin family protein [Saprospiraceae bacterium]
MEYLPESIIKDSIDYTQYRELTRSLLEQNKTTASLSPNPGIAESPALLEYTELNEQRMRRLDKTFRLDPEANALLQHINRPLLFITITESWCGDAAQIIPALNALAEANPHTEMRYVLRDQHPEFMDAFLTNGGRSIPIVVVAEADTHRILGSWGPRPKAAQQLVMDFKKEMENLDPEARKAKYEESKTVVHSWYAKNKTVDTQREFLQQVAAHLALVTV